MHAACSTATRTSRRIAGVLAAALAVACLAAIVAMPVAAEPDSKPAGPPPGYYSSAIGKTGAALRQALHGIVKDHTRVSYSQAWALLAQADENPNNPANVLTMYKNSSELKVDHSKWNREHTWPKSYGFPVDGQCNYPYTDGFHLHAEDPSYNSSRGNKPFDYCPTGCTPKPVDGVPGAANQTKGSGATGTWEVWNGRRGDIARAMFYMDVRYEGGNHAGNSCPEPDLILTDNRSLISSVSSNAAVAHMGILSVLVEWSQQDPVDVGEQLRNDVVFGTQHNRNPFIDNPQWVCDIFPAAICAATPSPETATTTATSTPPTTASSTATIDATIVPTSTWTPTQGITATATATVTLTIAPTPTSSTPTETASATVVVTATPTVPVSPTLTSTVTNTPTVTITPTMSISPTVTISATLGATATPSDTAEPVRVSLYLPYVVRGALLVLPTVTLTSTNTPVSSDTPWPTLTSAPTYTPKATEQPNTPPPPPTATPTLLPPASISISTLQCDGRDEFVRVVNYGGSPVNMQGWQIFSVVGSQTFTFPSYTLEPGATVTVHSGPDAPPTGGSDIRWTTTYIWNSSDGDRAELKDQAGTVVHERGC